LRTYELVTIFTPETLDDAVPESTERVHKLILNKGGAIGRIQRWGKRRLSYPINHHTEGHYVLTNFEMEPTEMSTLDSELQVSEEILRHMIVRVDEEVLKAEIAASEAAAARQAEQAAARAAAQAESEKAREAEATVANESATATAEDATPTATAEDTQAEATAEEAPAATEEEPATADAKVETVAADAAPAETDDSEGGSPTESETPTASDEPETEEPAKEDGDESESKGAS
jgi:small subunit ribosomal protein S6